MNSSPTPAPIACLRSWVASLAEFPVLRSQESFASVTRNATGRRVTMCQMLVIGGVGWAPSGSAPLGPPSVGASGHQYPTETPVGGTGRSHVPYGTTVPIVGTVPAQHRGRLSYQVTTKPQNCPPMDSSAAGLDKDRPWEKMKSYMYHSSLYLQGDTHHGTSLEAARQCQHR